MLVLKRVPGDRIRLTCADGTVIVLKLIQTHGKQARIGIDAPMSVKIDREELEPKLEKKL